MSEIAAPAPTPVAGSMDGILASGAPNDTPAQSTPGPDEQICETLYIQNLNEKIKPDGMYIKCLCILELC